MFATVAAEPDIHIRIRPGGRNEPVFFGKEKRPQTPSFGIVVMALSTSLPPKGQKNFALGIAQCTKSQILAVP